MELGIDQVEVVDDKYAVVILSCAEVVLNRELVVCKPRINNADLLFVRLTDLLT
jgi:hypothetical protein